MALTLTSLDSLPVNNNPSTSQRKIEANRRNAQLSTGPRTTEGKKTASGNAAKHWLLAKDVVITTGGSKEDQAEFDGLLAEMRDYYCPVGIAEDLLVQEIATSYWRSARAFRCERGDVTSTSVVERESELSELEILILTNRSPSEAYGELIESSRGVKFLLQKVDEAKTQVESSGSIPTELRKWLAPAKIWNNVSDKQLLLAALEREISELTAVKVQVDEDELHRRNARRDVSSIPSKESLDRIHRYETSNVRHRYKVEARLERLQALRKEQANVTPGTEVNAKGPGEP